jgi:DUF1365 family protein
MFMMYLDLDELPNLFESRWLWSTHRPALARFCRKDHFGKPTVPLDQSVRELVERETGKRPEGPIRLLTHLRYFGYVFNPVSFYYCFNGDGRSVETIVAEVNNTPWGERHCYVLPQSQNQGVGGRHRHCPEKQMHVSPFMPMDNEYDWRFNRPEELLTVHMENSSEGRKIFDASLVLKRRELTSGSLTWVLLAFPMMTMKIIGAIYWQALKLWAKGVPVYDHPSKRAPALEEIEQD